MPGGRDTGKPPHLEDATCISTRGPKPGMRNGRKSTWAGSSQLCQWSSDPLGKLLLLFGTQLFIP